MGQLDLDELINHVDEQPQEIDKELQWMQEKTGFFSASELERLMSKTDTWTEANIKYLYELQYRDWETDRKSTRLNSSHSAKSRMPSSA